MPTPANAAAAANYTKITRGADLMNRLNDGSLQQAPSAFLARTREEVSTAIEELIEVGARIRPLLVAGARIGWVRGVHPSERKALKRWLTDEIEFIEHLMLLGTTMTIDEIERTEDLMMLGTTLTIDDIELIERLHMLGTNLTIDEITLINDLMMLRTT